MGSAGADRYNSSRSKDAGQSTGRVDEGGAIEEGELQSEPPLVPEHLARTRIIEAAAGEVSYRLRDGGMAATKGRPDPNDSKVINAEAEKDRRKSGVTDYRPAGGRPPGPKEPLPARGAPSPDDPIETWGEWAAQRVRATVKEGGGVRPAEWWNPTDVVQFLGDLVEFRMRKRRTPVSSKTRSQAKGLLETLGGDETKLVIEWLVANWKKFSKAKKIDSAVPTLGIALGYLENILNEMEGHTAKKWDPSNRDADTDWDDVPTVGWS